MDPGEVVAAMWHAMQERDWDTVTGLLDEGLVVEWPASDERIVGRANFVGFNRHYPEGWSIRVLRIVVSGYEVVSEVEVPHVEAGLFRTLGFWTVRGGRIVHGREYWKRLGEDPSPAWCAPYVEAAPAG